MIDLFIGYHLLGITWSHLLGITWSLCPQQRRIQAMTEGSSG